MHTVPLSFAFLTCFGFWIPPEWSRDSLKFWVYNVYSIFTTISLNTLCIWSVIDALLSADLTIFMDKISVCISAVGVVGKNINLFIRREDIIRVTNKLLEEACLPRDDEEELIQQKFNTTARKLTIWCEILNLCSVCFATIVPIRTFVTKRTLPLSEWVPYDVSSPLVYWTSFLFHTITLMMCASISVAHETLIAGLMIESCAQLEILGHRFRNLPNSLVKAQSQCKSAKECKVNERSVTASLIRHHLEIYEFALGFNEVFSLVIFMQFCISSTVLALSIFGMSATDLFSVKFTWGCCYLGSMLMQVFLYCWFGNEVTLQSMNLGNAVYEMDWTRLPVDIMKDLIIIMARCTRAIKMSSAHIIVLSADSFTNIVKTSYSSFNLLKGSN